MRSVLRHIDTSLAALSRRRDFGRRLAFAIDTHSFENWLRTEIAAEISRGAYAAAASALWAHPEQDLRTDIPVKTHDGRTVAKVELKVLYNRTGRGKRNVQLLQGDISKLSNDACSCRVVLAMLVFLRYRPDVPWPHLKRLDTMDAFEREVRGGLRDPPGHRIVFRRHPVPVRALDWQKTAQAVFLRGLLMTS